MRPEFKAYIVDAGDRGYRVAVVVCWHRDVWSVMDRHTRRYYETPEEAADAIPLVLRSVQYTRRGVLSLRPMPQEAL